MPGTPLDHFPSAFYRALPTHFTSAFRDLATLQRVDTESSQLTEKCEKKKKVPKCSFVKGGCIVDADKVVSEMSCRCRDVSALGRTQKCVKSNGKILKNFTLKSTERHSRNCALCGLRKRSQTPR